MKASFVSSLSVSQAMRHSLQRMQADLIVAQKEFSTQRVADAGLALGARTGQSVSFSRDMERLQGIVDSNGIASARLKSTQDSLSQLNTLAQSFLGTLTASAAGDASVGVTLTDARGMLEGLTSILNSSLNGEHLFAGINTDVKPINEFKAGSPNKAAYDAAFFSHFGFAQTDPAAANITSPQMKTFMDTVVEPQFLGAGWSSWSSASDQPVVSRITLNETAETSVSANNDAFRKLAMAAAMISDTFSADFNSGARGAAVTRAIELVGEALGANANIQSQAGIAENRLKRASERLDMQIDLFERNVLDMEGVDSYEATNRVKTLLSQIEASYAITANIRQLSLMKFLT